MDKGADRIRFFQGVLPGSAFLFIILLAVMSGPAVAASPITGVSVTPATASVHSGQAVYLRAAVQGSGDFDHRVTWSLAPPQAGSVSPTGLFISDPAFSGSAAVTATSVENPLCSGAATINVSAGGGVVHVDLNNGGAEDGSALHPFRTIQGGLDHAATGDTVKVAQGLYLESVVLPYDFSILLLGGFKGGSSESYAADQPGDFITRSTDHVNQVTTILNPAGTTPVVSFENWAPFTPMTVAVDGFTLTGGLHGIKAVGRGSIDFFICQNLATANGTLVGASSPSGGGVHVHGFNLVALNNHITNNQSGFGGGFYIASGENTFLVQGNVVENNRGGGDIGGGGCLEGQGLFTWNVIQNNQANLLLNYGRGGGLSVGGGPMELSHNIYADNSANSGGGGILVYYNAANITLRHELIYRNQTIDSGAAGIFVQDMATNTSIDHCTITSNYSPEPFGNGLTVWGAAQVSNSIIWGNSGSQMYNGGTSLMVTYTNSEPYPGTGNISVDPLFANPATDDYHLKSRGRRWNPVTSTWVRDLRHSPCINTGNPAAAYGQEPIPNGCRVNMGAYGNTPEASKSQVIVEWMSLVLLPEG